MRRRTLWLAAVLVIAAVALAVAGEQICSGFFYKSLHATGRGMKHWYEAKSGFMQLTGIPYDKLGCKKCHVSAGCDVCHAVKADNAAAYSVKKASESDTCLKCHAREKATFGYDKKTGFAAVHADMGCMDCHTGKDVHGDGNEYISGRQKGVIEAKCTNCHKPTGEGGEAPNIPSTRSHKVHGDRLACAACHVSNSFTCYNCHFDEFLRLAKAGDPKAKPKSMVGKVKSMMVLVNHYGQVTSGTFMTLTYKDKGFIAYVPFHTHSVMGEGRACGDCHGTDVARALAKGEKVRAAWLDKDGKVEFLKGAVVPASEKLEWVFLKKEGGKWVELKDANPLVQWAAFAEPLTKEQLGWLAKKMK